MVTSRTRRESWYPTWWRHQMETFSALLALCAGNSPVPGEFPTQRPVTRSFDVYFDLRPNKRLGKQSWGWWFQTLSWSLWRHRNEYWIMAMVDMWRKDMETLSALLALCEGRVPLTIQRWCVLMISFLLAYNLLEAMLFSHTLQHTAHPKQQC